MAQAGVGLTALAKAVDSNKQTVARYRDGKNKLPLAFARKAARALKTSPERLMVPPEDERIDDVRRVPIDEDEGDDAELAGVSTERAPPRLEIISDNEKQGNELVLASEITIVGRAVARLTRL